MKPFFTIFLMLTCLSSLMAQVKDREVISRNKEGRPNFIKFQQPKVSSKTKEINKYLKSHFRTNNNIEFKPFLITNKDDLNTRSHKMHVFYKGIKVEFASINIISKNDKIQSIIGDFSGMSKVNIVPKLTEKEALAYALKEIDAKKYFWEDDEQEAFIKKQKNNQNATNYPTGQLVILKKEFSSLKASGDEFVYKFKIKSLEPFNKQTVYVSANSGKIVKTLSSLNHANGTADTRYSGQRNIETQQVIGGQYILKDNTRGNGIETYDLRGNGNNFSGADDFTDNDNNWTAAEFDNADKDNAGLDAHWGAMKVYDYFLEKHDRNSIDNQGFKLKNYVNADLSAFGISTDDNAFWDKDLKLMVYGEGEVKYDALTSIDIVAHEIGHGLYNFAVADETLYEREMGAINESLSDIWAALISNYAAPEKDMYLIGEEISLTAPALRSFSNPKSLNKPDTYKGDYWDFAVNCFQPLPPNDWCGVHTNSSVMNYWFYVLAEGDVGMNDNGDMYSISGIGIEKAAKIVYRLETVYLENDSKFADVRNLSISAAQDLYGLNSLEAYMVQNAWYAVGVGNPVPYYLEGSTADFCNSTERIYTIHSVVTPPTNWEVSSNLAIIESTNRTIKVKPLNPFISGDGYVASNVSLGQMRKDFWVGRPVVTTNPSSPSVQAQLGSNLTLQAFIDGGLSSSLNWTTNDLSAFNFTGNNSSTLIAECLKVGSFTISVQGSNSCGSSFIRTFFITVTTGGGGGGPQLRSKNVENQYEAIEINNIKTKVYPNPINNNEFTVSLNQKKAGHVLLQIINVGNGKSMTLLNEKIEEGAHTFTFNNLSHLSKGLYLIKTITQDGVENIKVVKSN